MHFPTTNHQLDRRLGHRILHRIGLDIHPVMHSFEERPVGPGHLLDQQVKRRFSRLELIAFVFQILNPHQDLRHQLVVLLHLESSGGGDDVGSPREFTDQNAANVADGFRWHVFVTGRHPVDSVHMHAALVSECTLADIRLAGPEIHVRQFVDVPRQLDQVLDTSVVEYLVAGFLQGQVGDHADQVGIATAFPNAVDGALQMHDSPVDRGQGIGHSDIRIVVAVDPQRHIDRRRRRRHTRHNLLGHPAPVRVAQHDRARPRGLGCRESLQSVLGVG